MNNPLAGFGWYVGDMSNVNEKGKLTGMLTAVIFEKNGGPKRYVGYDRLAEDAMEEAAKLFCAGEGLDPLIANEIVYQTVPGPEA